MAKTKSIRISTPIGKAIYPKLNEPDYQFSEKGVFSTGLRLTEAEAEPIIAQLQALLDSEQDKTVGEEELRKLKKMKQELTFASTPWKPAEDRVQDEDGDWIPKPVPGYVDFRVKLKAKRSYTDKSGTKRTVTQAPTVVDKYGEPVTETIGGGSQIQVGFRARPFFQTNEVGYGLSLQLDLAVIHSRMERDDLGAYGFTFEAKPEGEEEEAVAGDSESVDFE